MKSKFLFMGICFIIAACSDTPMQPKFAPQQPLNSIDQVCDPSMGEDCGGGPGGGGEPCASCDGLALGSITNEADCVNTSGRSDADLDGIWDLCEFRLADSFKPDFYWDSGDGTLGREPYFAVARLYGIGGVPTYRIFYAIGYYEDGGTPITHTDSHHGDSEFVAIDVQFDGTSGRWFTSQVFLSAHFGEPLVNWSRWFDQSELTWSGTHYRGRPIVWVAKEKHANYVSQSECERMFSEPPHQVCNGLLPGSLLLTEAKNLGSSSHHLVDGVGSAYPSSHTGTEYFWTGSFFCGWTGLTCQTGAYGPRLIDFQM